MITKLSKQFKKTLKRDKWRKARPARRASQSGNVFFTLFGAVALVGVLGAGIMSTMRGPLSTMVEINRIEEAKADMRLGMRLILLNSTDTDSDAYTEPVTPDNYAGGPTGAGQIPSSLSANKNDPWGTKYAYCAWDHGLDTSAPGNLLAGSSTGGNNITIALMSAGPDRTFSGSTTCAADPTYVPTLTAGDDIVIAISYAEAAGSSGGLWSVGGTGDTAEIGLDLEVTGGATFTDVLDVRAASLILPDETALSDCTGLENQNILRIDDSTDPAMLQVCTNASGSYGWQNVAPAGIWSQDGSLAYYNTGNVGIGDATPDDPLDVVGNVGITGNIELNAASEIVWDATGATLAESSGALTLTESGGTNSISVAPTGATITGDTVITGSTTTSAAAGLNVTDSGATSILYVRNDGNVGIGTPSPTENLTVNGTSRFTDNMFVDGLARLSNANGMILNPAAKHFWLTSNGLDTYNIRASATVDTEDWGSALFTVDKDGFVGINNDTPDDALDVVGDIEATGAIDAGTAISAGTTLTAAGKIESTGGDIEANGDLIAGNQILIGSAIVGPIPSCDGDNEKLEYTGTAWACIDATGGLGGTGTGGALTLEDILGSGNDAENQDADDFNQIGADEYCSVGLASCITSADLVSVVGGGGGASSIDGLTDAVNDATDNNLFLGTTGGSHGENNDFNTAVGILALSSLDNGSVAANDGNFNTALGYQALRDNTAGQRNVALGRGALKTNTSGDNNVAIGDSALDANTTGGNNVAIGSITLTANTNGLQNTAIGARALRNNIAGDNNVAIGYEALTSNGNAVDNVAVGKSALTNNTWGAQNTAIGTAALGGNVSGTNNVAMGRTAGSRIADGTTANETTGTSVFIGASTKASADGVANEIVIGYDATGIGSNTVTLGNDSIVTTALKGAVGIGDTTPDTGVGGSGQALLLDVEGPVGATHYCDADGENCVAAASLGSGGSAGGVIDADSDTQIQVEETADEDKIRFDTAGAQRMIIDEAGLIGFNVNNPLYDVDISSTDPNTGVDVNMASWQSDLWIRSQKPDGTEHSEINFVRTYGATEPGAIFDTNRDIASLNAVASDGSVLKEWASIRMSSDENGTITQAPGVIRFLTNKFSSLSEKMRIDSDGNVGIGTTAPVSELHVDGGTGTGEITISSGATNFDAVVSFRDSLGARKGAVGYDESQDTIGLFHTATFAGATTGLVIDNAGNVGIGDTTPDTGVGGSGQSLLLDVEGAIGGTYYCDEDGEDCFTASTIATLAGGGAVVADADYGDIVVSGSGGSWDVDADVLDWDNLSDTMTLDATTTIDMTAGDLNFDANTLFIDSSTNRIGIGTTAPASRFHLYGGSLTAQANTFYGEPAASYDAIDAWDAVYANNTDGGISVHAQGSSDYARWSSRLALKSNGSGTPRGALDFITRDASNVETTNLEALSFLYTGEVGIGTESPAEMLSVKGAGNTYISVEGDGAGFTGAGIKLTATNGVNRPAGVYSYTEDSDYTWYSGSLYSNNEWGVGYTSGTTGLDTGAAQSSNAFLVIESSGEVGIGTTAPDARLDLGTINGAASDVGFRMSSPSIDFDITSYAGATDNLRIRNATADTDLLTILSSGNVGIGTTAPGAKLDIDGGGANVTAQIISGADATNALLEIGETDVSTSSRSLGYINYNGTANELEFGTDFNGTQTRAFYIGRGSANTLFDGTVGIGTTAPDSQLTVAGAAVTAGEHLVFNAATSGGNIGLGIGYSADGSVYNSTFIRSYNGRNMYLGVNTAPQTLTLDDSGNVGIGDTSPDTGVGGSGQALLLDVEGPVGATHYCDEAGENCVTAASLSAGGSGGTGIIDADSNTQIQVEETADENKIRFDTAGVERMIIDDFGSVGIGTSAPTSDLHIVNNAAYYPQVIIENNNNNADASEIVLYKNPANDTLAPGHSLGLLSFRGEDTTGALFNSSVINAVTESQGATFVSSKLVFDTTNSSGTTNSNFVITGDGNVGVGVFSPAEKLDVAGTVYADGFRVSTSGTTYQAGVLGFSDATWGFLHRPPQAGSSGAHHFEAFNGDDLLTITEAGNVGIGTTSPLRKLVAQGDAVTSGEHRIISAQTSNGNESVSLGYDANGSIHSNAFVRTNNGRPLHLGTNTTSDAMVILDDGSIGIGTASPIANSLIEAEKTESSATSGTHYGLHVDYNLAPSSTLTGNMTGYGVYSIVDGVMDPSTFTNTLTSGYFFARHDTANIGHDASSVNGSWHLGYHLGSGTATSVRGSYAEGRATHASGAATNLYGIQAIGRTVGGNATTARGVDAAVTAQGGTITTARGVDSIINETSGGVITNGYAFYGDCNDATTCYGLYITAGDPDVTTDWGVYVTGEDKNYFSADVGIGTTTPAAKLHINTSDYGIIALGNNDTGGFHLTKESSDDSFNIWSGTIGSATRRLIIDSSGNVGIGIAAPTEKLEVNGNVEAVAYLYSSDRTLKKNIEPLDNALEKIMALDGVGFDWREAARAEENGHQIGLIAQDVKKIYPEIVRGEEGDMSVNYAALVAPLIESVKTLKAENDALKVEQDDTNKTVAELAEQVNTLNKLSGNLAPKASSENYIWMVLLGLLAMIAGGLTSSAIRRRG